jgi:hypothetical protein
MCCSEDDAVDEDKIILCCAVCCAHCGVYTGLDCPGCSGKIGLCCLTCQVCCKPGTFVPLISYDCMRLDTIASFLTRCWLCSYRSSLSSHVLLWPQVWKWWMGHCEDSIASLLFGHFGGHSLWWGSPSGCQYFGSGTLSQDRMLHASSGSHATIVSMECVGGRRMQSILCGRGIIRMETRKQCWETYGYIVERLLDLEYAMPCYGWSSKE